MRLKSNDDKFNILFRQVKQIKLITRWVCQMINMDVVTWESSVFKGSVDLMLKIVYIKGKCVCEVKRIQYYLSSFPFFSQYLNTVLMICSRICFERYASLIQLTRSINVNNCIIKSAEHNERGSLDVVLNGISLGSFHCKLNIWRQNVPCIYTTTLSLLL